LTVCLFFFSLSTMPNKKGKQKGTAVNKSGDVAGISDVL
jgi:hypothetical protein